MVSTKVGWRSNFLICVIAGLFLCLYACKTTDPGSSGEQQSEEISELSTSESLLEEPVDITTAEVAVELPPKVVRERPTEPEAKTLKKQAGLLGISIERGEGDDEWILRKGERSAVLREGSRKAYADGVMVFMNGPLVSKWGRVYLNDADVDTFLRPVFGDKKTGLKLRSRLIMIDPGHGGAEGGAANNEMGLLEKELTLDVSNRLAEHLASKGYATSMTRYDDRVVPLGDRPDIANRAEAGVFVSVHFNASLNKNAQGLETYTLTSEGFVSTGGSQVLGPDALKWPGNNFDFLNAELALAVQRGLLERLQRVDRGLKKARFRVLKTLDCPGILVECGFVSHGPEALLVRTPVYREKLAQALADAIDSYMIKYAPASLIDADGAGVN